MGYVSPNCGQGPTVGRVFFLAAGAILWMSSPTPYPHLPCLGATFSFFHTDPYSLRPSCTFSLHSSTLIHTPSFPQVALHVIKQHRYRPPGEDGRGAPVQETIHDRALQDDVQQGGPAAEMFMKQVGRSTPFLRLCKPPV